MQYADKTVSDAQKAAAEEKLIKMYREQLGWSVEETARRLRTTVPEYQAFERRVIAVVEGCTFEDVFYYLTSHLKR